MVIVSYRPKLNKATVSWDVVYMNVVLNLSSNDLILIGFCYFRQEIISLAKIFTDIRKLQVIKV